MTAWISSSWDVQYVSISPSDFLFHCFLRHDWLLKLLQWVELQSPRIQSLHNLLFLPPQPREKGRMRFHKLQNVQIALDFLRHRQVWLYVLFWMFQSLRTWPTHDISVSGCPWCACVASSLNICCFVVSGQAGQHQKWWHSRWEPQADPGVNMDHYPPLPGLLFCQCYVSLHYSSTLLSLGSVGWCFPSPWNQPQWILLFK